MTYLVDSFNLVRILIAVGRIEVHGSYCMHTWAGIFFFALSFFFLPSAVVLFGVGSWNAAHVENVAHVAHVAHVTHDLRPDHR